MKYMTGTALHPCSIYFT